MRLILRAACALATAGLLVWGLHERARSGVAQFIPHGWASTGAVSPQRPLVVDAAAGEIRVYARVNGKYFYLPTRHGMNYRRGTIGNKALFRAWANPVDVHQALLSLGAHPGHNLDATTGGQTVAGAELAVSVTWPGAAHIHPINDVITDAHGRGVGYRFGGNIEMARHAGTGCLMCFDSCPVGILSNARYPQGAFHDRGLAFRGRADVLPPDNTPVTVIFRRADT